jgi:hypothetical protein
MDKGSKPERNSTDEKDARKDITGAELITKGAS